MRIYTGAREYGSVSYTSRYQGIEHGLDLFSQEAQAYWVKVREKQPQYRLQLRSS